MNTIQKLQKAEFLIMSAVDLMEELQQDDGFDFGYIEMANAIAFIDALRDAGYACAMEADEREGQIAIFERKIAKLKGLSN